MGVFIIPDDAEQTWLSRGLTSLISDSLRFKLFKNNVIVGEATEIADLTEADYSAYTSQSALPGTVTTNPDHQAQTIFPTVQFPYAGSGTQIVYGYWCEDVDGYFYGAKNFPAPITVSTTVRPDPINLLIKLYQL